MEKITIQPGDDRYEIDPKNGSCWITCGTASIYVQPSHDGLAIDIYPLSDEMSESLASTWLAWNDLPANLKK